MPKPKNTKRVHRVEHFEDFDGPYKTMDRPFSSYEYITEVMEKIEQTHSTETHPSILSDIYDFHEGLDFCAFSSIAKLKRWFCGYGVRSSLRKFGFVMRTYEVPESFIKQSKSGKQLVFNREHATLISTRNIP